MNIVNARAAQARGWADAGCTILCAGGNVTCMAACAADGPFPALDIKGAALSLGVGTLGNVAASAALR